MNGGYRRFLGQPGNARKDRDEDLLLFREMHKREKDRKVSLLQPVVDELESNSGTGNYPLYKIASAKKGPGYDFLVETGKNDYDWLKTPPATPLFPSLEMDANAPEFVVQREIPIIQPRSRFSGNSVESKATNFGEKSPLPKSKVPSRSVTPATRASISSIETANSKGISVLKTNQLNSDLNKKLNISTIATKPINPRENSSNLPVSNPSKNTGKDSNMKPRSRGVSPMVRSRIPATIPGFSNETPPNLRTDRSSSASRGRPINPATTTINNPKPEPVNPRRQSCSPSMTRGRKMEFKQEGEKDSTANLKNQAGNGTLVIGSRMVEKLMNARKITGEEGEAKSKSRGSTIDSSGYGRLMSKSSLDMALKHMEIRRDPVNLHQPNIAPANKTPTTSNASSTNSSPRSSQGHDAGTPASWKKMENRKFPVKGKSRSNFGLC